MQSYVSLCQQWWATWLEGKSTASPAVRAKFDLEAAPEPYLSFEQEGNPLIVLTTNPGQTMPHQQRQNVLGGQSIVNREMSYQEAATALSRFYREHLRNAAARRIASQCEIARKSGYSGVLQVECCPWHSPKLPHKSAFVEVLRSDKALAEYAETLQTFLAGRAVVALSAASSRQSLASAKFDLAPWHRWKCDLIGLNPQRAARVPLVKKGRKVTALALVDRQGDAPKALVLMQGGNHFPIAEGQEILAAQLAPPPA